MESSSENRPRRRARPDKEPSEYDEENEDEYDPLDLAPMIAESVAPPFTAAERTPRNVQSPGA